MSGEAPSLSAQVGVGAVLEQQAGLGGAAEERRVRKRVPSIRALLVDRRLAARRRQHEPQRRELPILRRRQDWHVFVLVDRIRPPPCTKLGSLRSPLDAQVGQLAVRT